MGDVNHMLKLLTLITNQHQQLDRQAERHVKESHPFIERRNYEEDYNEDFLFSRKLTVITGIG